MSHPCRLDSSGISALLSLQFVSIWGDMHNLHNPFFKVSTDDLGFFPATLVITRWFKNIKVLIVRLLL